MASWYEKNNLYFYHPDHLGSSNFISDVKGNEFEHIEYTPYGETWIEEGWNKSIIGYKFTSKELDSETGLYYFGARYLDPRTSRWMSADPAMEKYLPEAPVNDEARQRNGNLPGMSGVFKAVNLAVHHYGANNPLKYVDPKGTDDIDTAFKGWFGDNIVKDPIYNDLRWEVAGFLGANLAPLIGPATSARELTKKMTGKDPAVTDFKVIAQLIDKCPAKDKIQYYKAVNILNEESIKTLKWRQDEMRKIIDAEKSKSNPDRKKIEKYEKIELIIKQGVKNLSAAIEENKKTIKELEQEK